MTTDVLLEVDVRRRVKIPSRTPGVSLNADLLIPVTSQPVPAALTVLPYRSDGFGGAGTFGSNYWLAQRGIATMLVDFRGIGLSEGSRRPPFDPGEADDAEDAIAWLAAQPWSNGRVGMWGSSYGAVLSLRTAARRPENLVAIAPLMSMSDPERDFVHPAGERGALASIGAWGLTTSLDWLLPPLHESPDAATIDAWVERLEREEPWVNDLWRTEPGDATWRSRAIDVGRIEIPSLFVSGWRDLFVAASLRSYAEVQAPKRLVAGPWMHTPPDFSPYETVEFLPELLAWWQRWLVDGSESTEPSAEQVDVYVENFGWTTMPSWPPTPAELRLVTLRSERAIPTEGTEDVGALSGLHSIPTSGFGLPLDQHEDDTRGLVFDVPLSAAVVVMGNATVTVPGLAGDERVTAKLADVDEYGRSTLISSGVGRAEGGSLEIELEPTAYRVAEGHTLRLVISTADFPRLWPAQQAEAGAGEYTLSVPLVELAGPPQSPFAPTSLAFPAQPGWELTRTSVIPTTTVTIPQQFQGIPFNENVTLSVDQTLSQTAVRGDAAATQMVARSTFLANYSDGQSTEVSVVLERDAQGLSVAARLTAGGATVFERDWSLPD